MDKAPSEKYSDFFIIFILKKKTEGNVNNVIMNRLNECKPITFKICKISFNHDVLYAHKFQGKPVNNFALKQSDKAKLPEKISIDGKSDFKKGPINKIVKAMNKLKKSGTKINANGIRNLKFSSKVSEFVIQDTPLKQKPKPNNNPNIKKFFL